MTKGDVTLPALLKVTDLSVRYGNVAAVRSVDLSVGASEIVVVLGANGAGKSSLLNAIAGAAPPSGGRIEFDGNDSTNRPPEAAVREGIALSPEGRRIFSRLTVRENLRIGGALLDTATLRQRSQQMFELFPVLADKAERLGGDLSGGQQQMLAIARALMSGPKLLMLDEPSLGLAPIVTKELFVTISRLAASGLSILLVEQNVQLAMQVAKRAYVLSGGRVVLHGAASDLAKSDIEEAYLGAGRRGAH